MTTTKKPPVQVHIRWMIRRDMGQVLEIERACFASPWGEQDFLRVLRQRNCIGMVSEKGDDVLSFMVYELHKGKIVILNFAVPPCYRRRKVGTQMIDKLVSKLSYHRRSRITVYVRETNLDALLFLKSQQFRAVHTIRGHYEDSGEDGIVMDYRLDWDAKTEETENAWVDQEGGEEQPA